MIVGRREESDERRLCYLYSGLGAKDNSNKGDRIKEIQYSCGRFFLQISSDVRVCRWMPGVCLIEEFKSQQFKVV